ncbi:hypothetical protein OSB04_001136 [Centaurea solstitialis]|uniref:Membrane protein of ER body-like protein n=1 Tax=Centaurea solstitialis TaxID=347529 RepID=A0AA38TQF7_9ASTR|nr:hypothetical protein OSB04_001136 [Centaurea solstitialis]
MAEVTVEQWRSEVEEAVEVGWKAITAVGMPSINGNAAHSDDESSEDEVHPDENGGGPDDGNTDKNKDIVHESVERQVETGESSGTTEEVVEEEIVELEFEKVKLGTHDTMHCPNCKHEISKVILRRKVVISRVPVEPPRDPTDNIFGCFSCLSLFTSSETEGFNPFNIFEKRSDTGNNPPPRPVVREEGNKPDMEAALATNVDDESTSSARLPTPKYDAGNTPVGEGGFGSPSLDPVPPSTLPPSLPYTVVDVLPEPGLEVGLLTTIAGTEDDPAPATEEEGSASLEILKSVVYGGLMEVIASFSVVASAAASETTTLRIVALALASVVGGIFAIGHNLWDLRADCYGNSSKETKQEATTKYKALLGRLNYFPLHAVFAILSFVVFGMLPPVAYGFSYHKTSDKDYTIIVVSIVCLLCVSLLALFKACITKCKGFFEYVKTVVYYVTIAVSVSGASYVVGILVSRLIEELGLFDMSSGVAETLLPHAIVPSLASF